VTLYLFIDIKKPPCTGRKVKKLKLKSLVFPSQGGRITHHTIVRILMHGGGVMLVWSIFYRYFTPNSLTLKPYLTRIFRSFLS